MDFVLLKTNKEEQCIVLSQIGHWSVTKHHCNECGTTHYKLDVYDRKGITLCSLSGNKVETRALTNKIKNAMQHSHLPMIRQKIKII